MGDMARTRDLFQPSEPNVLRENGEDLRTTSWYAARKERRMQEMAQLFESINRKEAADKVFEERRSGGAEKRAPAAVNKSDWKVYSGANKMLQGHRIPPAPAGQAPAKAPPAQKPAAKKGKKVPPPPPARK